MTTQPTYLPRGDCYRTAYALMERMDIDSVGVMKDSLRLVHGLPMYQGIEEADGPDGRYYHAWVEVEIPPPPFSGSKATAYCISTINGRATAVPKDTYYSVGQLDESLVKRYTISKVNKMLAKYKHWGPWDADHPPAP